MDGFIRKSYSVTGPSFHLGMGTDPAPEMLCSFFIFQSTEHWTKSRKPLVLIVLWLMQDTVMYFGCAFYCCWIVEGKMS